MDTDGRLLMRGKKAETEIERLRKTLRDQFAMAALPGVIYMYGTTFAAKEAYEIADAMMKAREAK